MPDLSGYEVAQALRKEPWAANLVLIALTGWGQDSDRLRAQEAGFDHHMIKPVDADRLAQALELLKMAKLAARPRKRKRKPGDPDPDFSALDGKRLRPIMQLCEDRRGIYKSTEYLSPHRAQVVYELPLAEIVYDMLEPGGALALIVHTVTGRTRPPDAGVPEIPHEEITALIKAGEVSRVARLAEEHVDPQQFHSSLLDGNRRVLASTMRSPGRISGPVSAPGHP